MDKETVKVIIICLVIGLILGASFVVGLNWAKGVDNNRKEESYNQGTQDTINFIVSQVAEKGYTQINLANGEVLILVPYVGE